MTGHEYGSSSFKLVGVQILEMYNPLKKFFQQQQNAGKDKDKGDTTGKQNKKGNVDQAEKTTGKDKDKDKGHHPESDIFAVITKNNNKLSQTANSVALNGELGATQVIAAKTGATKKNQSVRFRQPKLVVNCFFTKYSILRKVVKHDFKM